MCCVGIEPVADDHGVTHGACKDGQFLCAAGGSFRIHFTGGGIRKQDVHQQRRGAVEQKGGVLLRLLQRGKERPAAFYGFKAHALPFR